MIEFKVCHHNINLSKIDKKLKDNKKKVDEINSILSNLKSLNISQNVTDLESLKIIANQFIVGKDNIVIFGTGGSNLGARALINLLNGQYKKNIIFYDNIDPFQFNAIISKINFERTGFIIISKSGLTPETLSQFASIIEIYKINNIIHKLSENCVIITENKDSPLKRIANKYNCQILDHDKDIGGRYSVFSNVGLFPAYIAGLNVEKIREGSKDIISQVQNNLFNEHHIGATIFSYLHATQKINLNVIITYSDALYFFGKWYLQLWAESIGKKNKGTTPIHAVGTTDQHSQLQLYLDGPKDKYFSLITTDYRNQGLEMNEEIFKEKEVNFLAGKTMGDLMYAEQQATLTTLINKGLPVREIFCNKINEYTLGQLMTYFMIETIVACFLFGVNPFNQPAVEQGKKLVKDFIYNKN